MSKKSSKVKISWILIAAFILTALAALFMIFAFPRAQAPEPTIITNSKVEEPTESNYVLNIPKLNLSAPIIINVDGNNKDAYNKALEGGVAHLLGSALPGKAGNPFIFGHSSYYAWKPGDYKQVFKNLNDLETGDDIAITTNLATYNYKVVDKEIVQPDDVSVANQNYSEKKLTLMTCWPVGSDAERLVVIGFLQE